MLGIIFSNSRTVVGLCILGLFGGCFLWLFSIKADDNSSDGLVKTSSTQNFLPRQKDLSFLPLFFTTPRGGRQEGGLDSCPS